MAIEKIKILGAVSELPAKQHCQSSPFTSEVGPNGLNWQCCFAGSSKTAPRILIFLIAIGADYSFDIKSGFSITPAFSLHKNFNIASVQSQVPPPPVDCDDSKLRAHAVKCTSHLDLKSSSKANLPFS